MSTAYVSTLLHVTRYTYTVDTLNMIYIIAVYIMAKNIKTYHVTVVDDLARNELRI